MLISGYSHHNRNPYKLLGGATTINAVVSNPSEYINNFTSSGRNRARYFYNGVTKEIREIASVPVGARPPYSWNIAQKTNGISSHNLARGTGSFTAAGTMGVNIESTMAGVGNIDTANCVGIAVLISALAGTCTVSGTIQAQLNMAANLAGTGDIVAALNALGDAIAALNGTSSLTNTINATGNMEAAITLNDELSPTSLASAVWEAIAENHNNSGTMGKEMNSKLEIGQFIALK